MKIPPAIPFRCVLFCCLFFASVIGTHASPVPTEPQQPAAALSPDAQKKLASLDAAYKSGVLTKEEYEAKKNALIAESAPAGQRTMRAGWSTHTDPSGFSVDLPSGWSAARDARLGRITLRGQRGENAVIWPMFVEGEQLGARDAGTLVQQLARKVDAQLPWGRVDASQNVVRTIAKDTQHSAAALMTWSADSKGTGVFFYCVEAPPDVYRSSTESFAGILQSFRILQDPSLQNSSAGAAPAPAPLRFVTWTDPREGAYTMAVPQGWHVLGGSYRLSATDIRNGAVMISPDSRIRVIVGDSTLGTFTQPNQMLAMAGLREGSYQMLGDGTKLEIRRYLTGQQFARLYAQSFGQRQCSGLNITSNNQRPDLASTFVQSARSEGMGRAQLTAGDVAIACNLNGSQVSGFIVVATIIPFPGQAGIWSVYRLYGYIAPPDRQKEAEAVYQQALQTWRINPQWQAQEQQLANSAVQQDNARSQQIRARAMQAIQDDQRHISDSIMQGYEYRSRVNDEISRRQENAILGTLDVVDPETGTRYKVSNYSDYHWMNNEGYMAGTNTYTSPGPDWRELVTLPY